jgi:hypothetical protein
MVASDKTLEAQQQQVCAKYGAPWQSAPPHLKLGVSRNLRSATVPIHGLRHRATGGTTGWFIWAGEGDPSPDPDFFVPLHVAHLINCRPEILRFLGLPAGWHFLTDGEFEDAWEDPELLIV